MQYILDEYEYEKLQRASSEQNDLLQEEVWDLQKDLETKDCEIARLKVQLERYRNRYGLLEEINWSRTEEARRSGAFNF